MSKVIEFNELARKNREMKFGSMEYNSLLPDLQMAIDAMYGNLIPNKDVNYVTGTHLCPNLETYNVHYDMEDFKALNKQLSSKPEDIVINHFEDVSELTEALETEATRSFGRIA